MYRKFQTQRITREQQFPQPLKVPPKLPQGWAGLGWAGWAGLVPGQWVVQISTFLLFQKIEVVNFRRLLTGKGGKTRSGQRDDLIKSVLFLAKKVKSKIRIQFPSAIVHILHCYIEPIVKRLQYYNSILPALLFTRKMLHQKHWAVNSWTILHSSLTILHSLPSLYIHHGALLGTKPLNDTQYLKSHK